MKLRFSNIRHQWAISCFCIGFGGLFWTGCQNDAAPQILAEIESHQITHADFLPRYRDFILASGTDDSPRVRDQVLNNMINEYLLASYTDELKLAETDHFRLRAYRHQRKTILASYRRQMIDNQIEVTEPEIREAFARFGERLRGRHLYAPDQQTADSIYAMLESGESFETLARGIFSDPLLAATGGDLGFFGVGDMDPAFEDVAFRTPIGSYSKPVETDYGFSIIKIDDRRQVPLVTETQFAEQKKQVRRYLKWKKTVLYERAFLSGLIDKSNITWHAEGVRKLAGIIEAALQNDTADSLDFRAGSELPEDVMHLPCLSSESFNWDIGTTLQYLGELQVDQVRRGTTSAGLKNILRGLIARELMLEDAIDRGIDEQRGVVREAEAAIRLEKAQLLQTALYDTVTVQPRAINAHFEQLGHQYYFPEEASVQLLMVRDSLKAQTIATQIRGGADFSMLIRNWSQWPESDQHNGMLGWVPRGKFGDWSDEIFAAKKGTVLGPRKIEDGWFFVRLLDMKPRKPMSLQEASPQISETLRALKQKSAFRDLINRLRSQANWTIYRDNLNELSLI